MIGRSGAALAAIALGAMLAPDATVAQPRAQKNALRPLLDCRAIAEADERLACFDRESATLDQADRQNELTVMDREDVRKTRRSLFGLDLSGLPFLGGDKDGRDDDGGDKDAKGRPEGDDGRTSITATIASARSIGYGKWAFTLDDDARWVTTEAMTYKDPAPGMKVTIKKVSLGGYLANFEGARSAKVRRVN